MPAKKECMQKKKKVQAHTQKSIIIALNKNLAKNIYIPKKKDLLQFKFTTLKEMSRFGALG